MSIESAYRHQCQRQWQQVNIVGRCSIAFNTYNVIDFAESILSLTTNLLP